MISTQRIARIPLPLLCTLALGACGGAEEPEPAAPARNEAAEVGEDCGNVRVPGHEAVDIRATGAECDAARKVAAAAEGRGREPYESGGFACEPTDADSGDTDYSCSMGSSKVVFRYGTT